MSMLPPADAVVAGAGRKTGLGFEVDDSVAVELNGSEERKEMPYFTRDMI